MKTSPSLTASWIWNRQEDYEPYHQVILARKEFRLARQPETGRLKIAVDGSYRLYLNGEWLADGPARSWPEHFQYDEIDATPYLQTGANQLMVVARHWQVGDFHTRPQQAGLLVQLDVQFTDGARRRVVSDGSWTAAHLPAWAGPTPKVSIQMEPQELYDARLEEDLEFAPAAVLYPANGGPWQGLHPRDVALLNRKPLYPRAFLGATLQRHKTDFNFCLPAGYLSHPELVEANHSADCARGMATVLNLAAPATLELALDGMVAEIDGVLSPDNRFELEAGYHMLVAFTRPLYSHKKERSLRIVDPPPDLRLFNAKNPADPNPWIDMPFPQFSLTEDDMHWVWFEGKDGLREQIEQRYLRDTDEWMPLLRTPRDLPPASLRPVGSEITCIHRAIEDMFVVDTHWEFLTREPLVSAAECVLQPAALMHDNAALTTVLPGPGGHVELAYDLGEQTVGYFDIELVAPAGVEVDIYAVEYIAPDGTIQHTPGNRNGLRLITRAGLNRFTSLKRRAGRYLFVTLREHHAPVQIRLLRVIESTYPVEQRAAFESSDAALGRVWEISARTLKLCMEDTFTDCPLYEQTHWVGDARNEAIFAYDTFGATDIALRSLRLTAQSLERYPIVGAQTPSSWDMLLPAWSFLWGIAAWDYYFYSGDRAALKELWPAVVANLQGAEGMLDQNGLFSGPYWNMFDWSGIDDRHHTVLHNSLLMVGAIQAAEKIAAELRDRVRGRWLARLRKALTRSINRCWDARKAAYPDSILEDGSPSPSTCQHTSFLALLYGVIPSKYYPAALKNTLIPPEGMVRVGSPFASMYHYEAMDLAGRPDAILASIYENYLPMLAAGATTVWEVFPSSGDRPSGFPTRSHTHAWSSAPLHFLPRVVLGIRQTQPGGAAYEISPWVAGQDWARGSIATARGPLAVEWRKEGADRLQVRVRAPRGVEISFTRNPSTEGLYVQFERGE